MEPGHKVQASDAVIVNGKKIQPVKDLVYILLNKPKDYLTTTEDERGRKTVLDLIKKASPIKVYPVGRLDRNTSGVLLLTNDGDLTQKLTHPSHEIKKVYAVTLDIPLVSLSIRCTVKIAPYFFLSICFNEISLPSLSGIVNKPEGLLTATRFSSSSIM